MEGEMVDSEGELMGTFKKYRNSRKERAILMDRYDQWADARPRDRREIYRLVEPQLNALGRRFRAPVNELWNYRLIAKWYCNEQARQQLYIF
jgi:hypothetical protein